MRSAGGTELGIVAVLGDYVRKLLGLDAYRASGEEVSRFIEEMRLYEREVSRFQFHISDDTITYVLNHLPVEVTGVRTDPVEVTSFRDVSGIETNAIRGGALRVVNDGIAGRAPKVWKTIKDLNLTGWDWLSSIIKEKSEEEEAESTYLYDIIAGRPVFSFPSSSKHGTPFRLRYGRARNTGLTSVGIHPATMIALDEFIAVGTQLRLEMPGKGGVANAVDTIEPPIVKLEDGSVVRLESVEQAVRLRKKVEKILFLGDLLVSFSEFYENEKPLVPSGFVEEWWVLELGQVIKENCGNSVEAAAKTLGVPLERLNLFLHEYLRVKPSAEEALRLSSNLGIPLHPRYSYFWRNITLNDFTEFRKRVLKSDIEAEKGPPRNINIRFDVKIKSILEKLLLPHKVIDERIVIEEDAAPLISCLGIERSEFDLRPDESIFQAISRLAGFEVRDKMRSFIGARMGRPEKAKERKMRPPVHVLFPTGLSGGAQRNIVEAAEKTVEVEIVNRKCSGCGSPLVEPTCPNCGSKAELQLTCPRCGRALDARTCPHCQLEGRFFGRRMINLKDYLDRACNALHVNPPSLLKGVKGLTNDKKLPEPLEKGLLRARHNITVFKDGTARYDATNATLTHFKPVEIQVAVEKLVQLGYKVDGQNDTLTKPDQVCELKVQDIIIPEKCADYLVHVSQFVDHMLENFYKLPKFYNVKDRKDLVGHLVVGLSPHTSAGVLGRIIGFSKLNVCYSHPLWVSAKRRDCDGDEDAVMLALETLLDFSREYLPSQIGGVMDAPLLLTPFIDPLAVDDQVWSFDLCNSYPLEFYHKTLESVPPKHVLNLLDVLYKRLGKPKQYEGYGFIHDVVDINLGVRENAYKKLGTMMDKLRSQMFLMEKIEGVDTRDVAKRVLAVHFMRDIAGNLRVFASQSFRCKRCNHRYRRMPLRGRCSRCGGQVSLTVYKGSVEKYLDAARWLAETYNVDEYHKQRIELVSDEIASLFPDNEVSKRKEADLTEFM